MRPKFLTVVLLSALGLLGMMALVERGLRPKPVTPFAAGGHVLSPERRRGSGRPAAKMENTVSTSPTGTNGTLPGDVQQSDEDADAAHEEYVRQRIEELDKLAREKGTDALNAILLELENPDKDIRKGALDATLEFRDRSSIPRLREIAASTQDPEEKVEILKAIKYLELPTLTERLAELQDTNGAVTVPGNSLSPSNR